MLGEALRTAVHYVKAPLVERSYFLTRWIGAIRSKWRFQRMMGEQTFPKDIEHILIICKGNICRSPLAEAYLKHVLAGRMQGISVGSAGLETSVGRPAHNFAKAVGQVKGLALESHETRPLLKEHIEKADLIILMEYAHRHRLLKLFPHAKDKTYLLRQFASSHGLEIADPYSGTMQDFEECFDIIRQSCDSLVEEICKTHVTTRSAASG